MKQPHRRLNLNDDLAIFYSGGSGGHYLLHWILLYKKHYTNFSTTELKDKFISQLTIEQKSQLRLSMDSYQNIKDSKWPNYEYYLNNFDQFQTSIKLELHHHHSTWGERTNLPHWFDYQFDHILQNQWNTSNHWKSTEHWPDNPTTLSTLCPGRKYKIYFFCNDVDQWKKYPGKKVVLYTDIFSQIRMSLFKRANWFLKSSQTNTKQIIRNILKNNSTNVNNEYIYNKVVPAIEFADQVIKLQDLINNPTDVIDGLMTDTHINFRNHWKSLHPTQLLEKCKL